MNPDIQNNINPTGSHTRMNFTSKSVGGRRRRRHRKTRGFKRTRTRRTRTRRHRHRKLRGGSNPTYMSYATVGKDSYLPASESALATPHVAQINRMWN